MTPTIDDYDRAINTALVVLDTNVLLNLYRYNVQARHDLFAVLEKLGSRLWIPHQVATEFWRNRESAVRDFTKATSELLSKIETYQVEARDAVRAWANRISLAREQLSELEERAQESFEALKHKVALIADGNDEEESNDTNGDGILTRLGRILAEKVGPPPSKEERDRILKEAARRIADQIPPGYLDKGKSGTRASGDYVMWAQTLSEATARELDVLLITGDTKADWWREENGQTKGPRIELSQELQRHAGKRLFMMRPDTLLFHARRALRVEVNEASLKDVERVDQATQYTPQLLNDHDAHTRYVGWRKLSQQYEDFLKLQGFHVTRRNIPVGGEVIVASREQSSFVVHVARNDSSLAQAFVTDFVFSRIRRSRHEYPDTEEANLFPVSVQYVIVFGSAVSSSTIEALTSRAILVVWRADDVWLGNIHAAAAGIAEVYSPHEL